MQLSKAENERHYNTVNDIGDEVKAAVLDYIKKGTTAVLDQIGLDFTEEDLQDAILVNVLKPLAVAIKKATAEGERLANEVAKNG